MAGGGSPAFLLAVFAALLFTNTGAVAAEAVTPGVYTAQLLRGAGACASEGYLSSQPCSASDVVSMRAAVAAAAAGGSPTSQRLWRLSAVGKDGGRRGINLINRSISLQSLERGNKSAQCASYVAISPACDSTQPYLAQTAARGGAWLLEPTGVDGQLRLRSQARHAQGCTRKYLCLPVGCQASRTRMCTAEEAGTLSTWHLDAQQAGSPPQSPVAPRPRPPPPRRPAPPRQPPPPARAAKSDVLYTALLPSVSLADFDRVQYRQLAADRAASISPGSTPVVTIRSVVALSAATRRRRGLLQADGGVEPAGAAVGADAAASGGVRVRTQVSYAPGDGQSAQLLAADLKAGPQPWLAAKYGSDAAVIDVALKEPAPRPARPPPSPKKQFKPPKPLPGTYGLPSDIPANEVPKDIYDSVIDKCLLVDCSEKPAVTYYVQEAQKNISNTFAAFSESYNLTYDSPQDYADRLVIFNRTINEIERINVQSNITYFVGPTYFSSWTGPEYNMLAGIIRRPETLPPPPACIPKSVKPTLLGPLGVAQAWEAEGWEGVQSSATTQVPAAFDWRALGLVTVVKFQGQCRSCWAFAAAAAIETLMAKTSIKLLTNISAQAFLDCFSNEAFLGCDGGDRPIGSLMWAADTGIVPFNAYPYVSTTQKCSPTFKQNAKKVFAAAQAVDLSTPDGLYQALQQAPVAITIWADGMPDFKLYRKGIFVWAFNAPTNVKKEKEDHAVTLLGWGSERLLNGTVIDFWVIKNSWSLYWGEAGYVRIVRRGPWRPKKGLYWEGIYSASVPVLTKTPKLSAQAVAPFCPEPPSSLDPTATMVEFRAVLTGVNPATLDQAAFVQVVYEKAVTVTGPRSLPNVKLVSLTGTGPARRRLQQQQQRLLQQATTTSEGGSVISMEVETGNAARAERLADVLRNGDPSWLTDLYGPGAFITNVVITRTTPRPPSPPPVPPPRPRRPPPRPALPPPLGPMASPPPPQAATIWQELGGLGGWYHSNPRGLRTPLGLSIDSTGSPLVAFSNVQSRGEVTVIQFRSGMKSWADLNFDFSEGGASFISLAQSAAGAPTVAFFDRENRGCVSSYSQGDVLGWDLLGWVCFTPGLGSYMSLAFHNDLAYAAYSDEQPTVPGQLTVQYLEPDTEWRALEITGLPDGYPTDISLAINGSGVPWVSFVDKVGSVQLMGYDGATGSWFTASSSLSIAKGKYTSLAFDKAGKPCVAFNDDALDSATVICLDTEAGNSLTNLGPQTITASEVAYTRLVFHPTTGVAYLAFADLANGNLASVMYYHPTASSTWLYLGNKQFSPYDVEFLNLAISVPTNELYVAFAPTTNTTAGGPIMVMRMAM